MRRTLVLLAAALVAVLATAPAHAARVLVLTHGQVVAREDPLLGPPDPFRPTAADARAARAPVRARPHAHGAAWPTTVSGVLRRLTDRGVLAPGISAGYRATYADALATARRLTGRRRAELEAVIGNVQAVAANGGLTSKRLPLAFLTLARNRQWWAQGRLLSYGERVTFGSSPMVWQAYPGQGLQVQWVGTFGKVNALWSGGRRYDARLRALIDEILPLASPRAGGPAWEYWFRFDGGRPPWVSGMAQGTAVQSLARASQRLADPSLAAFAHSTLGIFRTAPPVGVRVPTAAGAHYLLYSFAPGMRVLNAFIQTLNGLHDLAQITGDQDARDLYEDGLAEARVEVPRYDTGAWSLYEPGKESDLGYHTLVRDFLRGLCDRVTKDRAATVQAGATPTGAKSPAVFCTTAERFTTYLQRAPAIALAPGARARVGAPAAVGLRLSKIADVTLTVRRGGRVLATRTARLGRGAHTLVWGLPARAGTVALTLRAVDLAGNAATATATQRVGARRR